MPEREIQMERHRLLVLYGSQTGTAQDVAEHIAMQSRGTHFRASALALDSYPLENMINESMIVFVCSTTGQGEPPNNMKKFWRFIMRKNLPADSLKNVEYAVLGLGDSSYTKFNFIAKKLNRRLQQLAAKQLVAIGLADDQHDWGADATIDPWVTALWQQLLQKYPTPYGMLNPLGGLLPPPRFEIKELDEEDIPISTANNFSDSYCKENPFMAPVKSNIRVTAPDHFQKTMLMSLDITQAYGRLAYQPGDVVMIRPLNMEENVNQFLELFPNFNPEKKCYFVSVDQDFPLPFQVKYPSTLRDLANRYLDFMSVPRRSFFQTFQYFADDELEKEKLKELATPEGTDERYDYVNRPRRNILEIFQDFHKTTKNVPLCRIFDLVPEIQPRAHSIASSPSHHKDEIHVLVAVVKYNTRLQKPRCGLCSTWIASLSPGCKVPIWLESGGIRFPGVEKEHGNVISKVEGTGYSLKEIPIIAIGPGTGVAPFRSAIFERSCRGVRSNLLFFGCRSRNSDYYFSKEFSDLANRGFLEIHTAFSRDQDEKIYVQHKISENGKAIWNLISNHNAHIYVAGNSKNMPDGVRDAFLGIFKDIARMTPKQATDYCEMLQRNKRYQQETWS